MTDTNEFKLCKANLLELQKEHDELITFLRGEYTTRLTNELGDHIALKFLLGLLRPYIHPKVPVDAAVSVTDKIKQIMALDMDDTEKDKLLNTLMGRE